MREHNSMPFLQTHLLHESDHSSPSTLKIPSDVCRQWACPSVLEEIVDDSVLTCSSSSSSFEGSNRLFASSSCLHSHIPQPRISCSYPEGHDFLQTTFGHLMHLHVGQPCLSNRNPFGHSFLWHSKKGQLIW